LIHHAIHDFEAVRFPLIDLRRLLPAGLVQRPMLRA
jgi:hypothetical protein